MSNINKLFIFILFLAFITGCKKSFLELETLDRASVNNSFKTPDDANRAVIGIYDITQQNLSDFAILTERTTDDAVSQAAIGMASAQGDIREIIQYKYTGENGYMRNMWNTYYKGIAASNQLIERIESITFSNPAIKAQYVGEVKFLRAYFYFNLVRFFGGVPISLTEIKDPTAAFDLKRSSEAEVYEVISQDLIDAAAVLPIAQTGNNLGRITQGAAKALLAKAYLTNKKPELALPLLRQLTAAPYTYKLMPSYPEVFSTENNAESIFEIQYLSGLTTNEGNNLVTFFFTNDATVGKDYYGAAYVGTTGGGILLATNDLYNSYLPVDARQKFTLADYFSKAENATVRIVRKYYKLPATGLGGADDNVIVLRYADVLLMLAEAINETNGSPTTEAYDAVDKVRVRAKVPVLSRTMEYNSFKASLLDERRWEFAFEFHRWFDLKRFGKLVEVLKAKGYPIQPFNVLFPIPKGQVDINPVNIPQNPGY